MTGLLRPLVLLLALAGLSTPVSAGETVARRLVLLGTGTPNPEPARSGPAVAVVVGEVPYLVDFGAGVMRRAEAARRKGITALAPGNIRVAFATHLHSDHTIGLADLLLTGWVGGDRDVPLALYGPPGLAEMAGHIIAAYRADIDLRVYGPEPRDDEGWRIEPHEILPGRIIDTGTLTIEAFAVCHGSWPHAYGYKFTAGGHSIVISGDTTYCPAVEEKARGADILLHEVYDQAGFKTRRPDWQRYHAAFHTSSHDLARLASAARPKLLVLYHQLFMGQSEAHLLKEIGARYDGPAVSGHDLDIFPVPVSSENKE